MKKAWNQAGIAAFWVSWPALFAYLYFSKRTRVVISHQSEVLLVKGWLSSGKWMLPGGGLHLREDTILGALREVKEETGIQLDAKQIKFLEKRRVRDNGLSSNLIIYSIELLERPSHRPQKLELIDAKWFPIEDVLRRIDITKDTKRIIALWQGNL